MPPDDRRLRRRLPRVCMAGAREEENADAHPTIVAGRRGAGGGRSCGYHRCVPRLHLRAPDVPLRRPAHHPGRRSRRVPRLPCSIRSHVAVLVGEINEEPIEGFDLTNSPSLILAGGRAQFEGRTVVHRTTSGVTGALARRARALRRGAARFVRRRALRRPTTSLAAGPKWSASSPWGCVPRAKAPEDEACGDYIESLLGDRPYDHVQALAGILADETARKFLRNDKPYLPSADPALCLQRDLFDFALRAERRGDRVESRKIAPNLMRPEPRFPRSCSRAIFREQNATQRTSEEHSSSTFVRRLYIGLDQSCAIGRQDAAFG